MKILLLAVACALGLSAQSVTFSIHDNTGQTADVPLPSAYQFASTRVGDSTTIMIAIKNISAQSVIVNLGFVGAAAGTSTPTANYALNGLPLNKTVAPSALEYFTVSFTPTATGQLFGYLQVEVNSTVIAASTLEGTGLPPQFLLTYNNGTQLFPSASSPLDFGSVSTSSSTSIAFTLTNETTGALATPAISINAGTYTSSAFVANTSSLPATIAAGATASFTVTFSPGQTGQTSATLIIGSNSYSIKGTGIVVSDIDALEIYYVDSTGVRTLPQAATPISFGQVTPGGASNTLTFTVANPTTSYNSITLPAISLSGGSYAVSNLPSLPASIAPGAQVSFTVSFNASSSGTYTGTIAIGTRVFSLTGLAVVSPVPAMSLHFSSTALTSSQQVTVTVEAATAATQEQLGTLTMTFTPSVSGVTDDPAVEFIATSGRTLSVDLAAGATSATYQGTSALAFQTGTTAGTLTFTLSFTNTAPITQSFTIAPAEIHITTATAERESPNLVLTISGYDNTYSAGSMTFTFYDLKGKVINSTPLSVDAGTNFHSYFFHNNQAGGAFSMQATFPVTGDVTEIGSVAVTLNNSVGATATTLQFQ